MEFFRVALLFACIGGVPLLELCLFWPYSVHTCPCARTHTLNHALSRALLYVLAKTKSFSHTQRGGDDDAKSTRGDEDTRRCDLVRLHRACAYECVLHALRIGKCSLTLDAFLNVRAMWLAALLEACALRYVAH